MLEVHLATKYKHTHTHLNSSACRAFLGTRLHLRGERYEKSDSATSIRRVLFASEPLPAGRLAEELPAYATRSHFRALCRLELCLYASTQSAGCSRASHVPALTCGREFRRSSQSLSCPSTHLICRPTTMINLCALAPHTFGCSALHLGRRLARAGRSDLALKLCLRVRIGVACLLLRADFTWRAPSARA